MSVPIKRFSFHLFSQKAQVQNLTVALEAPKPYVRVDVATNEQYIRQHYPTAFISPTKPNAQQVPGISSRRKACDMCLAHGGNYHSLGYHSGCEKSDPTQQYCNMCTNLALPCIWSASDQQWQQIRALFPQAPKTVDFLLNQSEIERYTGMKPTEDTSMEPDQD